MRLKDKVVLLAGVGERSSRATAVLMAREGAQVAIAARRDESLQETAEMIRAAGGQVLTIPGDGTVEADVQSMVERTVESFGRLDVLYNNVSGMFAAQGRRLHEFAPSEWQGIIDAILNSAYLLSRAAIPHMLEQGQGVILHVAASENVQLMGNAAYGAGKGGVVQLTRNMAREYHDDRIRVNCIAPGFMLIKPWSGSEVHADPQSLFRREKEKRHGEVQDIAFAAVYLASDEANWITGQTLVLDGGDDILSRRQIPPPR